MLVLVSLEKKICMYKRIDCRRATCESFLPTNTQHPRRRWRRRRALLCRMQRVKDEPDDESFTENDDRQVIDATFDVKNVRIFRNHSAIQECNENNETELDELKIEFECRDMKPSTNFIKVEKIVDYSQNHSQYMQYSDDYKNQNITKTETADRVKKNK
uniref:Uncharacterized protein n=1 Tax=Trichogramma kaykai TaxID=54128 RepID=A0ABD2WEA2_9HYME